LAFDDDFTTPINTAISGNVIVNNGNGADNDPEGQTITVINSPLTGSGPNNGNVTISANGDFTYTPNSGFVGVDTFDYEITDPSNLTATATATVTITIETVELEAEKNVEMYDPLSEGLFAIPGNDVVYTITITNVGNIPTDNDTMFLVDQLPTEIDFFTGDFDGAGNPVLFADNSTGLTFNFGTDLGFLDGTTAPNSFIDCSYTPVGSYDPNVNFICFNPKGVMATGSPNTSFDVSFAHAFNKIGAKQLDL